VAWVLLFLIVAVVLWFVASYVRLISMRKELMIRWRQIDLQLRRRHDLVLQLVTAVRGAMAFEREAVAGLMEARERALGAAGPSDAARRENELSLAVEKLFSAASKYPALEVDEGLVAVRRELLAMERQIRVTQRSYNDTAGQYNAAQRVFLMDRLAGQLGVRQAEGFE